MRTTPIALALAAGTATIAKAQNSGPLDFGIGNQCDDVKKAVSQQAESLIAQQREALKSDFPTECLTDDKVRQFLEGELHQLLLSCYYNDKVEPLNNGEIRYFTPPRQNAKYDPSVQPNLLAELQKHKGDFMARRIGNDFAAVSKSAPEATMKAFKEFNPQDGRLNRPETVSSMMQFLFLAGKGEVPDFDRAVYALSCETQFTSFLQQNELNKPFPIPAEIVKVAIKEDPTLTPEQKEAFLSQLNDTGEKLNIGKGADAVGKAVHAAMMSIVDECPSISGQQLPMRETSLTGTSSFFPMKWKLEAISDESTQKKTEL